MYLITSLNIASITKSSFCISLRIPYIYYNRSMLISLILWPKHISKSSTAKLYSGPELSITSNFYCIIKKLGKKSRPIYLMLRKVRLYCHSIRIKYLINTLDRQHLRLKNLPLLKDLRQQPSLIPKNSKLISWHNLVTP